MTIFNSHYYIKELEYLNDKIEEIDNEVLKYRDEERKIIREFINCDLTIGIKEQQKEINNLKSEVHRLTFQYEDLMCKYGKELKRNENLSARMEQLTKYLKMVGVIELEKEIEILKNGNPNTLLKNQLSTKDKIIKKLMKYKYKYEISKK